MIFKKLSLEGIEYTHEDKSEIKKLVKRHCKNVKTGPLSDVVKYR